MHTSGSDHSVKLATCVASRPVAMAATAYGHLTRISLLFAALLLSTAVLLLVVHDLPLVSAKPCGSAHYENGYRCPLCPGTFRDNYGVRRHLSRCHAIDFGPPKPLPAIPGHTLQYVASSVEEEDEEGQQG